MRWAVPGIVPEGLTLFVAPPKSGKTHATTDIGLGLAVGGVALGKVRTGDPRPVCAFWLEDSDRRVQSRCRHALAGAPIPALLEYMTRIEPGRVLDTIQCWLEAHDDEEPVGILDTLGKVMPPTLAGESAYRTRLPHRLRTEAHR